MFYKVRSYVHYNYDYLRACGLLTSSYALIKYIIHLLSVCINGINSNR